MNVRDKLIVLRAALRGLSDRRLASQLCAIPEDTSTIALVEHVDDIINSLEEEEVALHVLSTTTAQPGLH